MGRIKNNINYPVIVILFTSVTVTYAMNPQQQNEGKLLPEQIMRRMYGAAVNTLLQQPHTSARKKGQELILKKSLTQEELTKEAFESLPIQLKRVVQDMPKVTAGENILENTRVIPNYPSPQSSPSSPSQLDPRHRERTSSETSVSSTSKLSTEYESLNPEGGSDDENSNEEKEWCMVEGE
jgi:hypothetical protein